MKRKRSKNDLKENEHPPLKKKLKNKPTMIEICAGAGGLSAGFEKAGFDILLLNEINKDCCQTLRINHKNIKVSCKDVRNLSLKKYNNVDVLVGGIPCQSFSVAGLARGLDDKRGEIIYEFIRLIKECNPKTFLIENVKGLYFHDKGKTLKHMIELIGNDGKYKVEHKVLNSNNHNVPQKRERLFIVGIRNDLKVQSFEFPCAMQYKPVLKDVLENIPLSMGSKYPEKKIKVFDLVPQGGCWIDLPKNIQEEYMGQKMIRSSGGGSRGVARRLSMEKPCLTLLTSPSQKQTERIHPLETRPLTTREYARIQTFPDDYEFYGSMTSVYKQIGNAVPVNMAQEVAFQIKKLLV